MTAQIPVRKGGTVIAWTTVDQDDYEEDDLASFLARETERAARRWQRERMNRRATEGAQA